MTTCLVPISPAESADQEREDRLTEEMETNLFDGDVISLLPDAGTFAAVEMESQADSTRGASFCFMAGDFMPIGRKILGRCV